MSTSINKRKRGQRTTGPNLGPVPILKALGGTKKREHRKKKGREGVLWKKRGPWAPVGGMGRFIWRAEAGGKRRRNIQGGPS